MGIGAREIMILLVIALLLFGASRLPALARSLGRSARILKAEAKGLGDENDRPDGEAARPDPRAGDDHGQPSAERTGHAPPPASSPGYGRPEPHDPGQPRYDQARPVPRASLEGPAHRPGDGEGLPQERPATDR
ncbi:twin-arginine translocase TatA/TatE family subunit [Nocardiopsis sp. NPDC101807]|uniref:twin-arginine translocase TatA/TatE family subunit n=1 Tax=Nocardiopsis sp. NPDC101807 TaxID=3364339 RepID=UPI0037FB4750